MRGFGDGMVHPKFALFPELMALCQKPSAINKIFAKKKYLHKISRHTTINPLNQIHKILRLLYAGIVKVAQQILSPVQKH